MKNNKFYALGLSLVLLLITSGCLNDLNTQPQVQLTPEQVKSKVIEGLLSKVYSTYALSGSDALVAQIRLEMMLENLHFYEVLSIYKILPLTE